MYISQDPIRLKGGYYLYSFVKNANRYLDPLGLTFEELAKERERRGYLLQAHKQINQH